MSHENLSLDQIKQVELDILIMFDKLCKEHGLSYQLAYGTLIGAVRHKGFIPWDDDIDLMMPYEDYLKLCDIVNNMGTHGIIYDHYRVADYHVQCDIPYHQPFMKIYDTRTATEVSSLRPKLGFKEGVFIDIFYYNGIPDDEQVAHNMLAAANKANDRIYFATKTKLRWELNPLRKTFWYYAKNYLLASTKSYKAWLADYFKAIENTPDSRTARQAFDIKAYGMCGDAYVMRENIWEPTIDGEFEGHLFPIPERYDDMLTQFYGDYMTPPPADQQIPSHDQGYYFV